MEEFLTLPLAGTETLCPPKPWLDAFLYKKDATEIRLYPTLASALIELVEPEHQALLEGIVPSDISSEVQDDLLGNKRYLVLQSRKWPWETPAWMPGIGFLLLCCEGQAPPLYWSGQVLESMGWGGK